MRRRFSTSLIALGLGLSALALGSCNNPYDLLVHDRFEQAGFNSDVDILWVVDNSNSMSNEQTSLAENFGAFISQFANVGNEEGQVLDYDTVGDATIAWAEFIQNQDRFLNYNMGVVTTDPAETGSSNGTGGNLRSLSAVGSGNSCDTPRILRPQDDNVAGDFVNLVNVGISGAGSETGILNAAWALCKGQDGTFWDGLDSLPDNDPVKVICGRVPPQERATGDTLPCNADAEGPFFREGAAAVVIFVSDEGDAATTGAFTGLPPEAWLSQCVDDNAGNPGFGECSCKVQWFNDFFDGMGRPVVFASISPSYQLKGEPQAWCDGGTIDIPGPCNEFGSSTCSLDMYQQAACESLGLYVPISQNTGGVTQEDPPNCEEVNFQDALTNIGALISGLSQGWRLSLSPDLDSISVFVDDVEVPRQSDSPSGGWRYVPTTNGIAFAGEAVPGFNSIVDIYYLPAFDRGVQAGRDLPF